MDCKYPITLCLIAALNACGGGGGGGGASNVSSPSAQDDWVAGVFYSEDNYANLCVNPRRGIDPTTNLSYRDESGTTTDQNNWLRAWSNNIYLWYDEVVDRNPSLYSSPDYFDLLVTEAFTASGKPKDQFHYSYDTDTWIVLSQSGAEASYGAQWIISRSAPPREIVVAYTSANTPATAVGANLSRGTRILEVDGIDVVYANSQAEIDSLNNGLFPESAGETHQFLVQDLASNDTRTIIMTSADLVSDPVSTVKTIATGSGNVGYVAFHSHLGLAEQSLISAVNQLQADGISDLILDLRYNGGGYLTIASELAYMIAGPAATNGKAFERLVFNDKHPKTNPITGEALQAEPFYNTTQGFSVSAGQGLPTLDLNRVFVITGENTCSASESIINGLRGIDIDVVQIGGATCGKPYGSYPTDNCGTTYFTLQFATVNEKDFGDYADGFAPENNASVGAVSLPGCAVADDLSKRLGDESEQRLAAALQYRNSGTCPTVSNGYTRLGSSKLGQPLAIEDGIVPKTPWLQNKIIRPLR